MRTKPDRASDRAHNKSHKDGYNSVKMTMSFDDEVCVMESGVLKISANNLELIREE